LALLPLRETIIAALPTWWSDMNVNTMRPDRRSTAAMNLCCIAFWKALRVSWTTGMRCSSIIVFSTSVSVVVALVKRDNCFSHGGE
jgi:hypothetical protein